MNPAESDTAAGSVGSPQSPARSRPSIGWLAAAAALGAAAAGTWGRLPAVIWGLGVAVAAALLVLAARRGQLPATAMAAPTARAGDGEARLQLAVLERRARQFDEAEKLVAVGSFDWWPARDELHWSEQHYRLWGYAPGEVVPSFEVYRRHLHPDDSERVVAELQAALGGSGRFDCTHRVRRPDGSVRHVHARGEIFFDGQRRPERMIGAVLDVTDRFEAEAKLRLHAFVLDAIPDAVSAVDTGRRFRLTNAAWHQMTGVAREAQVSLHLDQVFPRVISPERRRAFEACTAENRMQVARGDNPAAPASGQSIETRFLPFRDPAVDWQGVLMVSRDVTADEALRRRLQHSVDNLSLTLNTIGDAIFATDAQGPDEPVLFANEQLRRLWHIPLEAESLTTRRIIEHARPFFSDPVGESARIEAIIAGNLQAEDRLVLNDGRVIERRCIPTTRAGRDMRVWVFRDITAEARALRELADSEARQRTLLDAFPGYIWVVDADHRIVYLNPMAAAVYHPIEPKPGLPAEDLFGSEIYARLRPAVDSALAGASLSFEWRRVHQEARLPDVLLVRMSRGTGADGRTLCHAFGIDITSLRQAQEALMAAKEEAERANAAKSTFLSAMSHELRTPLNAVIGFSQVLAQNVDDNLNDRQLRQLGEIRKAGGHLLDLINDLLDLARIEAGHVHLDCTPLPLAALLDECLTLMRPLAQGRGCIVERDCPADAGVLADRMRLKQVLLNLLSNAVKFNRPDGTVSLRVTPAGERVCIEVRDEGPGLSADDQARLFQPFERLGADRAGIVGTGIGLALTRQLVLAMRGEISVDSAPGAGCSFRVLLPRADPPAAAVALPPAAAGSATPATAVRLLYVDDNPVNLVLMEGLFEGLPGHALQTVDNGSAALQQLRQAPVDLVLVDLQMPGMDGFAFYGHLRADPALQQLPAVAVSADATPDTIARCHALGFADYVTKPIDADRLQAAIDRALRHAG